MNKLHFLIMAGLLLSLTGCCQTYNGYGRYLLRVDCDKVEINNQTYMITKSGNDLVIEGHTFSRGIYRKTRPWLYIHRMDNEKVDITFEKGSKSIYPLYTGVSASIFDVYAHPWDMTRSTNAAFSDNYWLISHRWSSDGILFDLQERTGDVTSWRLAQPDILVPSDGTEVLIGEINTKVKIVPSTFNFAQKKAKVEFITP